MDAASPASPAAPACPPRRGLVLGGGGVLGVAWMVGALDALQSSLGVDLRTFDVIQGTSAGSILAALLGAGVSVGDLVAHQRGTALVSGPLAGFCFDYENASGRDRPTRLRPGIGSREMLLRNVRHLSRLPVTTVLSALLPEGWGNLGAVGLLVSHVAPGGWPARSGVNVVALDYDTGDRVVFGSPGSPVSGLADAVMASCSIPGWYHPVRIGDHRYIDGCAWSSTSLDLLASSGLDEVYVLAPMASFDAGCPSAWPARVERQVRAGVTRQVLAEVALLHEGGAQVTVVCPGQGDLAAMGNNPMNVTRRLQVLETSLVTSPLALADPAHFQAPPTRGPARR